MVDPAIGAGGSGYADRLRRPRRAGLVAGTRTPGPIDAKFLSEEGEPRITWWGQFGGADGYQIRKLDGTVTHTVSAVGGSTDIHELQREPNGDYLVISYQPREHVDLTAFGGGADDTVIDAEVQEINPAGEAVWTWNSSDHIGLNETGRWWTTVLDGNPRDIVHMNAVEPVGDDAILISLRHTDAVYKIDKATGDVIWKLGGTWTPKSLTVTNDPQGAYPLGGQHDVRLQPDGTITIHDNDTNLPSPPRVVRYEINEATHTAKLVEQKTDPEAPGSFCCGSARRSADGSWLISWGGRSLVTEFNPAGERTFRLGFGGVAFSYRAVAATRRHPQRRGAACRHGLDAPAHALIIAVGRDNLGALVASWRGHIGGASSFLASRGVNAALVLVQLALVGRLYGDLEASKFFVLWTVVWAGSVGVRFGFDQLLPKHAAAAQLRHDRRAQRLPADRPLLAADRHRAQPAAGTPGAPPHRCRRSAPRRAAGRPRRAWLGHRLPGQRPGARLRPRRPLGLDRRPDRDRRWRAARCRSPTRSAAPGSCSGSPPRWPWPPPAWLPRRLALGQSAGTASRPPCSGGRSGRSTATPSRPASLMAMAEVNLVLPVWIAGALSLAATEVGALYAAIRVAAIFSWLFTSVVAVITPMIATALAQRDYARLRGLIWKSAGVGAGATIPLAIVGALASGVLLGLIDPAYRDYGELLIALIAARLLDAATGAVAEALILGDHARWELCNQLASTAALIAIALLLEPGIGVMALALAAAISTVVANLLRVVEVRWLLSNRWRPAGAGVR